MYLIREYSDPFGRNYKGIWGRSYDLEEAKKIVEDEQQFHDNYFRVFDDVKLCTVYKSERCRKDIKELNSEKRKQEQERKDMEHIPRFST